jgi:hypothetical protein
MAYEVHSAAGEDSPHLIPQMAASLVAPDLPSLSMRDAAALFDAVYALYRHAVSIGNAPNMVDRVTWAETPAGAVLDRLMQVLGYLVDRIVDDVRSREPSTAAERREAFNVLAQDEIRCDGDPDTLATLVARYLGAGDPVTEAEGQLLGLIRDGGDGNRHITINRWRGLPQDGGKERWSVSVYDKQRTRGRGPSLADALDNRRVRAHCQSAGGEQ